MLGMSEKIVRQHYHNPVPQSSLQRVVSSARRCVLRKSLSIVLSASMLLGAGAASASAQGLPAGTAPPVYGSVWSGEQMRSSNMYVPASDSNMSKISQSKTGQSKTGLAEMPVTNERSVDLSLPATGGG